MGKLFLTKTLPHLIDLTSEKLGIGLYVNALTTQLINYLEQAEYYPFAEVNYQLLTSILTNLDRVNVVAEVNQYTVKGDVIVFWLPGYTYPIRAEFFDTELESLSYWDLATGRRLNSVSGLWMSRYQLEELADATSVFVLDTESTGKAVIANYFPNRLPSINSEFELKEFDYAYPQLFWGNNTVIDSELSKLDALGYEVHVYTKHRGELSSAARKFISDEPKFADLAAGFLSAKEKIAVFTDRELFGTVYLASKVTALDSATAGILRQFEGEIKPGDLVVHADHGVAIYKGLAQEEIDNEMREYLKLQYAGDDELLVPISQVNKLTKYIGQPGVKVKLTRLGRQSWKKEQEKVKHSVAIRAKELVEHYARRELATAYTIPEDDSDGYAGFVAKFPYQETTDQLKAVNDVISDLQSDTPMNRILIGDVGFGKTEVLLRAAYKVAEAGYQVAVLCPTTVLAAQHYAVFSERFEGSAIKVSSVSRFNSTKENRDIVDEINQGKADVLIGTHRLLSNDVKFKKLGLLIVDEEQRFGVKQKEKIRQINYGTHYLSASATPIPRTLSMALSTIQDISMLTLPPKGRRPIETVAVERDWNQVVKQLRFELDRGGQVYFVHNRVQSLPTIQAKLLSLMPGLKVVTAHGQMPPAKLDKVMREFYQGKYDVLLSTTIIENGLDLPNVNTMIINQAHTFGLAQLYQLRGRVGRSDRQAFCYLLYTGKGLVSDADYELEQLVASVEQNGLGAPDKTRKPTPKKYLERLQAIVDAKQLGSGFQVASRDLEIRGAGSMLGEKQSGHISEVGYILYMQMLSQEVERLKRLKEVSKKGLRKPEYLTL